MKIRLGSHDTLHNNTEIRVLSLDRCVRNYMVYSQELREKASKKLQKKTLAGTYSLGNEIHLLSLLKDSIFNSRELIDIAFLRLNKKFQISSTFYKFTIKAMEGNYDQYQLKSIDFYKVNFDFFFNIRAIRNEIKRSPTNIEFYVAYSNITGFCIKVRCRLPVKSGEEKMLSYLKCYNPQLNTFNPKEALKQKYFLCDFNLDEYFSSTSKLWNIFLHHLEEDISSNTKF